MLEREKMHENDNIFNLFDSKTKQILINCQKIARDMKSSTGTDHLLLALLITPNTPTHSMLKSEFSHIKNINSVIKIDRFKEQETKKNITREFESMLKLAVDNSIQSKKDKVTPEDLLWGIIKNKNCSAYKILKKLNIDVDTIEYKIKDYLSRQNKYRSDFNIEEIFFDPLIPPITNQNKPDFRASPQFIFENPMTQFNHTRTKTGKKTYLDEFGTNLTKLAKENKLDKVVGRDAEIRRILQILCRRSKNNPVLVGDPGVGKTAIVEGLAQKIVAQEVPLKLMDKEIIRLDLALTVAGTMYRGQFEARIKNILSEASKNSKVILFIDEIHTVIGTGSAEGSMDTANILKPALTRGELRLIGATTDEEYRKHIEKDKALERRLQKVKVEESSQKETLKILKGLKETLENYHNVTITEEALRAATELSSRYISDRFLPDKAIDLIDEAAAATHLEKNTFKKAELLSLLEKLKQIIQKKEEAIERQDFAQAAYLRSRELKIKQDMAVLKKKEKIIRKKQTITETEIAKIVSSWTQIPIDNLVRENLSEIKNLEKKLSRYVIGQAEAVRLVSDAIKRIKTKLVDPYRPLGNFMFLGPTGVGKTHLAKTLARIVFGSEKKLIKIDMSEFMERHNASRLVGAPPGYIGYDEAGKLTETVRNQPYSVILLDEIEKAHPDIFNMLLQIMEDGYLTDSKGRRVNFRNTIIIMTSNIGISDLNRGAALGFTKNKNPADYKNIKSKILNELKKTFKPEFLNRLDNIVVFKPLFMASIKKIVQLELSKLEKRLLRLGIKFRSTKKLIEFIAKKSYKPECGAREIRRSINTYIGRKISQKLLEKKEVKKIIPRLGKNKINFIAQ